MFWIKPECMLRTLTSSRIQKQGLLLLKYHVGVKKCTYTGHSVSQYQQIPTQTPHEFEKSCLGKMAMHAFGVTHN